MRSVAVVGPDGHRDALAVALTAFLDVPVLTDRAEPDLAVSSSPFADHRTRLVGVDGRLVTWDDLPELRAAVASRLARAAGDDTKAVLVLPSFPAADARAELEQLDDVDRFARAAVVDAGLDRWAATAIAWEPVDAAGGDVYGVRTAEVVGGLADLGRTTRIVVVPVGLDGDHPGIEAARRVGTDAGIAVDVTGRADLDPTVVRGLATRISGALT